MELKGVRSEAMLLTADHKAQKKLLLLEVENNSDNNNNNNNHVENAKSIVGAVAGPEGAQVAPKAGLTLKEFQKVKLKLTKEHQCVEWNKKIVRINGMKLVAPGVAGPADIK